MLDPAKLSLVVHIQFVVDSHPQLAGMIFEQRCNPFPRQAIPYPNGGQLVIAKELKSAVISNPDGAISRS
jgi:hypothetical protein